MVKRFLFAAILALPAPGLAGDPWDKPPEKWNLSEANQILMDSPWSPTKPRIEVAWVERRVDPLTRQKTDSPLYPKGGEIKLSAEIGHGAPLPSVTVLWSSAKTVRLAQQRVRQLRDPAAAGEPLRAEELPDLVLIVEGAESLRILRDAAEDLHDTVFLELPSGVPLDFTSVRFVENEANGEDFAEFHFPREMESRPTVNPGTDKVVFHCKARAKTAHPGRPSALSLRASFEPRKMRAAGRPDL